MEEGGDEEYRSSFPKLRLKLFGGPSTGEVFIFNPNPVEKIRVGRMNNCHI
jgi:hypothetical protein